jgi:Na+/H+ antiporter NhaD/arsenite permease-like protein
MFDVRAAAALAIFGGTYALFAVFERRRLLISGLGAALVVATGLVPVSALVPSGLALSDSVVEWNTLALLLGLFLFAALLRALGFFRAAALWLVERTRGRPLGLFGALVLLSFGLSAFLNSITVMLVLAVLTVDAARALGRDPIPLIVAEISASNAGGAATFVGDPPNVVLGTYFRLSFSDFLIHAGPPAVAALAVVLAVFLFEAHGRGWARSAGPPAPSEPVARASRLPDRPRLAVGLAAFAGALGVLAVQGPLGIPVWSVGLGAAGAALAIAGTRYVREALRDVDWETLGFFLFLFVLVGALVFSGDVAALAQALGRAGGGNEAQTGTVLLWTLGLVSTVVNNVPLAAAAAPLIAYLGATQGLAVRPLVYATALGVDIGGNGTPIGASANIVGLGVAARDGVRISWGAYLRRAFPAMLLSLLAANVVWLAVH